MVVILHGEELMSGRSSALSLPPTPIDGIEICSTAGASASMQKSWRPSEGLMRPRKADLDLMLKEVRRDDKAIGALSSFP